MKYLVSGNRIGIHMNDNCSTRKDGTAFETHAKPTPAKIKKRDKDNQF